MNLTKKVTLSVSAALLSVFIWTGTTSITNAGNYGCYKVTAAKSVNIRKRAWSKSPVIGSANRGEILVKWKAFCALRGFWCPVQKGNIKGHAYKKHLMKVDCP